LRAPLPKSNNGSAIVQYRSIPIVDARTEEEVCSTTRVCVSVDPKGIVCGVHTLGTGGSALSEEEDAGCGRGGSLPLAMLGDVVTSAAMASRNLYTLLNDGDGSGTNISCKTKDVNNDGGGYGYLLKNHFLIR
jgi:hypothetical protein